MAAWLPPAPPSRNLDGLRWWEPHGVREQLPDGTAWDDVSYVVLDELHEGVAGLVITPWPRVDDRGRLCFGDEDDGIRIATSARALRSLLDDQRHPVVPVDVDTVTEQELRTRELAIGDAFAAVLQRASTPPGGGGPGGEPLEDPASLLGDLIVDITAEAREAAKLQATAASSGVIDEHLMETIGDELTEDLDEPEPAA